MGEDKARGGRFAVAEGDLISPMCVQLISKTMETGGHVVATRDYHPVDHCSFMPEGPFPAHCVQGTAGSKFYPPIAEAMAAAIQTSVGVDGQPNGRASIAYKGFHEDIDSFGGLPYVRGGEGRITRRGSLCRDPFTGCNCAPWTGCLLLKSSGLYFDGHADPDAPPDLLAVHNDKHRGAQDLVAKLKTSGAKRLLVCGLALDFCVCDTALNAKDIGFDEVVVVLDACRPAHIPGLGQFGSGFLSDPAQLMQKFRDAGVRLTSTLALTEARLPLPPLVPLRAQADLSFPRSVGPFGVEQINRLRISMDRSFSSFEVTFTGAMRALQGSVSNHGICTPFAAITLPPEYRAKAKIPLGATCFCFAFPLAGVNTLPADSRAAFLAAGNDPNWRFICYGGFLYFDGEGNVLAANAIGEGSDLCFASPQPWRAEYTNKLVAENRFQPVTLSNMLNAGARHFAWIHAGETLVGSAGPWEPAVHGAFVYLFHDDPTGTSSQDIFFPVASP